MRTLKMKFNTDTGKDYTLSLAYAKDGLVAEDVRKAMAGIRTGKALAANLTAEAGAEIVERNTKKLF